jgi:TetR/AcrR family transcriptional regulator of autoinduction and epiphytic fitness
MVVKRPYQSARREQQARQTRHAILAAAAKLFVTPGYAATPLTAIAAEAGVAVQTVYAAFGSKRQLLSALVDVTIAGDDEPVALPDREFVAAIRAEPTARAKLARYARHLAGVQARQADVLIALSGAATADPDAAQIWRKNLDDRRRGMLGFAADLAATGEIRPGLELDRIADVLWLAMDVRNYDWLVRQRRWSPEQYQRWYADTVAGALLRDPSPPGGGTAQLTPRRRGCREAATRRSLHRARADVIRLHFRSICDRVRCNSFSITC